MTPLEESFSDILIPSNFVKNFTDDNHFRECARKQTINDLKDAIRTFEHQEMYHHCGIMQGVIDCKVDVMLSGLGFD
jgi:hypothetical protein